MAKQTENPNRIVTFLSDAQMAALKKISEASYNAPISALIRTAVEEFVERHPKKKS